MECWQHLRVCGREQTHHGQVTRWLYVGGEDTFTKSNRRQLMEALDHAGHLLDSLARQSASAGAALPITTPSAQPE